MVERIVQRFAVRQGRLCHMARLVPWQ
jgi:hypothetical protein